MSTLRLRDYHVRIDRLRKTSGSSLESVLRASFQRLLEDWSEARGLLFAPERPLGTGPAPNRRPDGTVLYELRVPHGYWEAKDTDDDLDVEIADKRAKGYPITNILFEDTVTAVLIQDGREVMRCAMRDADALTRIVTAFFDYEPEVYAEWRGAVAQFQQDLPTVLGALRDRIGLAYRDNAAFAAKAAEFLVHARETVNPKLEEADVREMLIQHVLTENIFARVFDDGDFHRQNNVARELYALEETFLAGADKRQMLAGLRPYYAAIETAASEIGSHSEKQTFLKVVYESFYKVYNPDAADRLGVVYTPNEIVRFMIRSTDWLVHRHFGRNLIDRGVEILDPAAGTGTFVCELLEHFRGQDGIARKFKEELHANEVAILPFYVANLNIEATYAAVTGQFAEYPNLCFVDTLDNVDGLGIRRGQQMSFLGQFTDENTARVKAQNRRKISVVIGNPPYNANQQNENDNNKNRAYPRIDERVKATFVKLSTAQKTKVYDMYARFYRWAFDRIADEGVVAFVTNRSFVDSRTFDGFRRYVGEEFGDVRVVDLGGDVRANPKLSGTKHNVFGIQTGVCIAFFVKGGRGEGIAYLRRPEDEKAVDKLAWLSTARLEDLSSERVRPDVDATWVGQAENDWSGLLPVADKKTKAAKAKGQEKAIFKLFSFGLVTNRDSWMIGRNVKSVRDVGVALIEAYEKDRKGNVQGGQTIKWTRAAKKLLEKNTELSSDNTNVVPIMYRPFDRQDIFYYPPMIEMLNQQRAIFGKDGTAENRAIVFSDPTSQKPFMVTAANQLVDMHLVGAASGASCLPLYRYTPNGERLDNITDWALNKFRHRYGKAVTKDAIFHYVYAALHDPVWRETYAINLRREFPRIPLHDDFARWAAWGEALMALHVGYEGVEPLPLVRTDADTPPDKPILAADPATGTIRVDGATTLSGLPPEVWNYRLGNRSGVDWVLDQHKEKKVRDRTVEAWLVDNPDARYRFADHKERVIDLIGRVAAVSVATVAIVEEMRTVRLTNAEMPA